MSTRLCSRSEKRGDTQRQSRGPADRLRLAELERLAREAHADALVEEARALAERAAEGRFTIACVGQFKRGKSTLLNALVGMDLLPTGVVPVTCVPTVLRHGELAARIRRARGEWTDVDPARLAECVTEAGNPCNEKGVLAVEVFVPSPLLASGLCLVDTPGLGSVFEASTEATRNLVPQIDAALVLLGADPPLSGEELALIEEIDREVDELLFVLNKADRVSAQESAEAEAFARRMLSERLGRSVDCLFTVSATERLTSGRGTRDWEALVAALQRLAQQSGRALVEDALRRGVARLGTRLQYLLAEQTAALQRPIAESEARLRALQGATGEVERALRDLGPLFSAEERRIGNTFAARRAWFLKTALPEAQAALVAALRADRKHHGPGLRRWAFQEAARIARERVEPWLVESECAADEAVRSGSTRFADEADRLLAQVRMLSSWEGTILLPDVAGEGRAATGRCALDGAAKRTSDAQRRSRFRCPAPTPGALEARRQFTFYDFPHVASAAGFVPLLREAADLLLPRAWVRRSVERDAQAYLWRLLETNAARVENDLKQRLEESRTQLERQIRSRLTEVQETAKQAMERARQLQEEGTEAVGTALARLECLQARLTALLAQSESPPDP